MPKTTDHEDGEPSDTSANFSEFGGHRLSAPTTFGAMAGRGEAGRSAIDVLASLGVEDAEQLISLASIDSVSAELQAVLGMREGAFQSLVERARTLLPSHYASAFAEVVPPNRGLGALAPTAEMVAEATAFAADVAEPIALPSQVNLISYFNAIRNQGSRGTCVAFTMTAMSEYTRRRAGRRRDLSEQHLYFETKQIDGAPNACGTWQSKAAQALSRRGQCRESIWSYNPSGSCNAHGNLPASARANGQNYRLAPAAIAARSVAAYKSNLAAGRPVGLSIPVWNSWFASAATRQFGRITMRIGNEPNVGGHAVLLVGYVDSAGSPGGGYFIVRNSWGTSLFGAQCPFGAGYGTIPYQYITNDAYEAFAAPLLQQGSGSADEESDDDARSDDTTNGTSVTIDVGKDVRITIRTA